MPLDIRESQAAYLEDIDKIESNAPVRVKLHMKDGSVRTEDASKLLTRLLHVLQSLMEKP